MEITTYGALCLLPIAIVIALALVTKKTFEPLLIATLVAIIIYAKGNFLSEFVSMLQKELADPTIVWVILVCGLMSALIYILEQSGAAVAFASLLGRFATTRKKAMLATWIFGICLFIDDFLQILTVGNTMKRITDEHKISRSLLACSIGCTASPVVCLAPISTWGVFFAGLLAKEGILGPDGTAFGAYLHCIPFLFYGWISAFIILPLIILGGFPLMGALKKQERRAKETGDLFPEGVIAPKNAERRTEPNLRKGGIWDFILPLVILVGATLWAGRDLLSGVIIALAATLFLYLARKLVTMSVFMDQFWAGFATVLQIFGMLVLAFSFKDACANLGFIDYVILKVEPIMSGAILPAVVFIATGAMAFGMANFWGLSSIVLPIAVSLARVMGADLYLVSAAVFCGVVFGSHACFYANTAILIGKATDIRPYDYAIAQLPYALIAATLTTILFSVFGHII